MILTDDIIENTPQSYTLYPPTEEKALKFIIFGVATIKVLHDINILWPNDAICW